MHEEMTGKIKKRLSQFMLVFSALASVFYLFVYPFLIASKVLEPNILAIAFGVFLYLQLLMLTTEFIFLTFSGLYNFRRKTLFFFNISQRLHKIDKSEEPLNRKTVVLSIVISYFFVIYSFAIAYLFICNFTINAFDKVKVKFIDCLFLSFTSISVGPSGIQPESVLTKILVMAEILIGLVYAALVFSLIASLLIREKTGTDDDKLISKEDDASNNPILKSKPSR